MPTGPGIKDECPRCKSTATHEPLFFDDGGEHRCLVCGGKVEFDPESGKAVKARRNPK